MHNPKDMNVGVALAVLTFISVIIYWATTLPQPV